VDRSSSPGARSPAGTGRDRRASPPDPPAGSPASRSAREAARGEEEGGASELRFRRLAENVRDAVVELAPEGRITYISPGLRRLLRGAEPRSRVGGSPRDAILERVHPEDQARVLDAVAAGTELAAPHTVEFRLRAGDGTWRWVEARTNTYTLPGGEVRAISLLRDVTQQRQALVRARRQEEILRIFVRHAPAAVAMLDRDLRYLLHSERWCTDYRLSETDLTGYQHYEVFPEIPERRKEVHRRALAGEVLRGRDERFDRADGSVDWLNWEMRPWYDADGEIGGILILTEVVTDQVRQRRERERLEARSRQAQRLESLGVLAGGVAHDFNNLLMGILGNAGLAREALTPGCGAAEALEAIDEAAQRAADLSRQLLAFAGRGRLTAEAVDLNALARRAIAAVQGSLEGDARLEARLDSELPAVKGDPGQLGHVVLDLLRNALEATEDGGRVRVSSFLGRQAEEDAPREGGLEATWAGGRPPSRSGPFAVLEVRDDGPGMDPATAERAFEPFFTTKCAGRGLGLAAALGIVHAHGGGLQVWSAPGAGTWVRAVLPVAVGSSVRAQPAPAARSPSWPVRPRSARVLVVDDEGLVRSLLRRALEAEGFEVVEAASGDEALARLPAAESAPEVDAVLLDLTMPGSDGGVVLRKLRARHPALPVALMSGYAPEDATRALRGQHPDAFLEKPFRLEDLLGVLRRMLGAAPSG